MKRMLLLLASMCSMIAADVAASKLPVKTVRQMEASPTRVVAYSEKDVIGVRTKVRFSTLILLPKNEQILDFICGDKDMWIVNGNQNFASVKPAKAGSQTNLNLITASGNVYSFVLTEVSEDAQAQPDVKIFVEAKEDSMITSAATGPKFVSAAEVDAVKKQLEQSKDETRKAKESTQTAIDAGISAFIQNVRFPFRYESGKRPFLVRAMYTDDHFTYILARPEETPALYEMKDGKPNLVNFEYKNGRYVVGKLLGDGYLAIGKQKLSFLRQE